MKRDFSFGVAALLTFGLFASQALAQSFCNVTGHTGTNTGPITASFKQGTIGDSHYEQWYDQGNNSSTFYSDGSFTCSFSNTKDYLCRSGKSYDKTKTWDQLGHLYADFSVKMNKNSFSNVGYSFIGIYGWTVQPLVEFYIVDNWGSQYRPGGSSWGWTHKGTVTVDGGTYDIYYHRQINQPAIEGGNTDFDQYYSVRQEPRSCGTIDISAHFEAWSKVPGWKLGKMYEAKVLGEAGNGNGGASGSFDFNYAKVYVSNTSPSSSSSTVQSSSSVKVSSSSVVPPSSSSVPVVVSLPGSIEFEDYQNSDGDFATNANSLGSINPNSWVEYTVDFTSAGYYDFVVSAARQDQEGNKSYLTVSVDGEDIGTVTDILTAGWTDFKDFSGLSTKEIAAGEHTLRVTFDYGWIDADKITFAKRVESSSSVPPSSSSIVPPSSSSVKPSSSSVEPPSSSSSEVPPSSSTIEPPPSSSSEVSSSSIIMITSSEVITPLSSANVEILYSSSSFFSSDSNGPVELVYGPIVQIEPVVNQTTEAIGNIRMMRSDRNVQVFDVQGRNLGQVRVGAGTSLEDALFAKFHRPGIYLVKQGSLMMKVRVSR
jgi:hypothetical protein